MNPQSIFATLAFLFSVAAYVPYTYMVLSGPGKPTLSAWLSWWIMDIAILAGMVAKGTIAMQMLAYVIGCAFVIAACLFRKATLGWKKLDSICVAFVVSAVVAWVLSGDANLMIIMSVTAACVGSIPMMVNVWHDPTREPFLPWVLILFGGIFGVAAIPEWSVAAALTPYVFLLVQIVFVVLIGRKFSQKTATI